MKYEVFWKNPGYRPRPELLQNIECDYLVVGGGIVGVSAAYFLAQAGAKNVVLVEKNTIGSGATGKAAGTLTTRAEYDLVDLLDRYGREKTKIFWQEAHEGLKGLKKIIEEEHIECEAEPQDTLFCGFKEKNFNSIYDEYEAEKTFEDATRLLEGKDLQKEIHSPLFTHGLLSKLHGLSVNPLKMIHGFAKAVEKRGVRIYEQTNLLRAASGVAETHHGDIRYKKIIWAIDADHPASEILNLKTTIIVTRPLTASELKEIGFSERKKIVWDTRKNENYFKVTHDGRLLIGFGGIIVHKKHRGVDPHFPHLKQLQGFIKRVFPYLDLEIAYAWSGHFGVNKHYSQGPYVQFEGDAAAISGVGSQVVAFMTAKHVVNKILGKASSLEEVL